MRIYHPIPPIYDNSSKILILGSFPSVKSRESEFFYGHPQNRFWKVISALLNTETPTTVEAKRKLLLNNKIALWDVIGECEINGSSDSSIKNAKANDIGGILSAAEIKAVFTNGKKAYELYNANIFPITGYPAIYLPSTSPANAAFSFGTLIDKWSIIKSYI